MPAGSLVQGRRQTGLSTCDSWDIGRHKAVLGQGLPILPKGAIVGKSTAPNHEKPL